MTVDDGFLLHHALVAAGSASGAALAAPAPERWLLVLHGILGSGANWRSFARRVATSGLSWGLVLCDLRAHGLSLGAPPPHTLASAADDLIRLEARLAEQGHVVRGVLGHSFGGKLALAYAAQRAQAGALPLDHLFVLDASPGARAAPSAGDDTEAVGAVLRLLSDVPQPLPSRERFIELVRAAGFSHAIAQWLAMTLRRTDDGLRLRLDLPAIEALLSDYFARDLFAVVGAERAARRTHVVLGGLSRSVSPVDRARLEALAASSSRVTLDVLPNAGHWLHVDDPDGLFALVRAALADDDLARAKRC